MLLSSCLRLDVSYHAGQSVKSLRVKVQHGLQLVLGHHEAVVQTATWTWNLEDSRRGICVALTEWVRNLTSLGFSTARQLGWIRLAIVACLSSEQTYIKLSTKKISNRTWEERLEEQGWELWGEQEAGAASMLRRETMLERLGESRSCSPALGRGSTPLQRGERISRNLFVIPLSKLWVVFLWTMSISILQPMECPIKVILQERLIKPCTHLYDFYKIWWMSFFMINDNPGV